LENSDANTLINQELRNIVPALVQSGTYMTSLNGPGFSITLLKATPDMIGYLEAPTDATGWGALNVSRLHDKPTTEGAAQLKVNEHHANAVESPRITCMCTSFSFEIEKIIH
jgi:dihydroxyacetone kinase